MKKIYIFISIFIISILLSPILGKYLIKEILEKKIALLSSKNFILKKSITDSSYLNTKQKYQFLYNKANQEILFEIDIRYSNLLFNKLISADIYPISLAKKIMPYKALLIHLKYNVVTQIFNGYAKDIKQIYNFKDGNQISLILKNALFNGKGKLDNPDIFHSSIEEFSLKNITLNNKNLGNLQLKSKLIFEKKLSTNTEVKLSKKLFKEIKKAFPLLYIIKFYAKNIGDNYFFHIKFKDKKFTINGKSLHL